MQNIPYSLSIVYLENIKIIDNLETSYFNSSNLFGLDNYGHYRLEKYHIFRNFQFRLKLIHMKKVRAIKTIQRACHDWVFAPSCRDDSIGIRPRLDTFALGIVED